MLVAANPIIITIAAGMTAGYSSILLEQLKEPSSIIKVNMHEESWIGGK